VHQRHLIEVDPQRVKFNPQNPRKHRGTEYIRLKASILAIGVVQPPIVRVLPGGFYEVIDGEGRVSIAQEEQFDKIWVVSVGIIDEHKALVMLQASNTLRSFNFLAECKGLANLHRQGMAGADLAKQFGSSETRISNMIAVGYFPSQLLVQIEEDIARSEKQAEMWGYNLLERLLPLREVVPGQTAKHGGNWRSLDGVFNYDEVNEAIKRVVRGEITSGEQMRIYVVNRKYEIYQERFDQDLHRKLEEELTRTKQELDAAREQQIHDIEEKTQQQYEGRIAALQSQLDDLARRHAVVVKEVAKRPEIVEQREKELRQELQKTRDERQQLQDLRLELAEQARMAQAKLKEEARQLLQKELAEQEEKQKQALKKTEEDLKEFYARKDQERQIKAENTIRGLLSHGIKSLAEAQQVLDHIVSVSVLPGVRQLGGARQENLISAIRVLRESLDQAEQKLIYGDDIVHGRMMVVQAEGGKANGYAARSPDKPI
jgi:hypothetical protein